MPICDLSLSDFTSELASSSPAPGGGSASALAGALSASLSSMVANLTIGKKGYEKHFDEMSEIAGQAQQLRKDLITLIDADSESFNDFLCAMKLPKQTDEEKVIRSQKIQQALKKSSEIPMQIAQKSFLIFDLAEKALSNGNQNAVTDALVSVMLARTAVLGALLNVRINLQSIKDQTFVNQMSKQADLLQHQTEDKERTLLNMKSFLFTP